MFVIHAGMHKTGSTAIQRHLAQTPYDDVHVLPWRDANHSDMAVLLFDDAPEDYWVFQRENRSRAEMQAWRAAQTDAVLTSVKANSGKTHVLSAERLARSEISSVQRMHDLFAPYADPFRVIIYVRPAADYMASMAQQYVRTGTCDLPLIWPEYRQAIEKFDLVFGRDAVDVRPFAPDGSQGWDAVMDFCQAAGLPAVTGASPRENIGMGARHLALLLERRIALGRGPQTPEETAEDHAFLADLLAEQSPPFALSPDMVQQTLRDNQDDLEWIEMRTGGLSMAEIRQPPSDAVVFSSLDDVLAYAASLHAKPSLRQRARSLVGRLKQKIARV